MSEYLYKCLRQIGFKRTHRGMPSEDNPHVYEYEEDGIHHTVRVCPILLYTLTSVANKGATIATADFGPSPISFIATYRRNMEKLGHPIVGRVI